MFLCPNHTDAYQNDRWTLALNMDSLGVLMHHELHDMHNRVTALQQGMPDPGRTFPPINPAYAYVTPMPGIQTWAYLDPPTGQLIPSLPPGRNVDVAPWTALLNIHCPVMWQILLRRSAMAFNTAATNPPHLRYQDGSLPRKWTQIKTLTVQLVAMYNTDPQLYINHTTFEHVPPAWIQYLESFHQGGGGQQANQQGQPNQQPNQGVIQQGTQQGGPQHPTHGLAHPSLELPEAVDKLNIAGLTSTGSEAEDLGWEGEEGRGEEYVVEQVVTAEVLSKRPRTGGPFGLESCSYRFATSGDFIYTPLSPFYA
ncbi:hypothetical protein FRB90_003886 [Tulasnella sp. 427]|nr:hypothetical protein FRB90_003886 [Tulasnella sp. 427]